MINWGLFGFRNLVTIAIIVLAVRFLFVKAVNALDGDPNT